MSLNSHAFLLDITEIEVSNRCFKSCRHFVSTLLIYLIVSIMNIFACYSGISQ